MFKKNHLSIYITNENVVASEFYKGIIVNETTTNIIKSLSKNWSSHVNIYLQKDILISILNFCVEKLQVKLLDSVTIILIIPVEVDGLIRDDSIVNVLENVNHATAIYQLENIVAVVCNFLKSTNNESTRRLYIYTEESKTYISLFWINSIVDFKCVEKELNELTKEDLINGINAIYSNLPTEIPEKYNKMNNINKFKHSWNMQIENQVYIIAPEKMRYLLGQSLGEYDLIYLDFTENIVLQGANEIIKDMINNK